MKKEVFTCSDGKDLVYRVWAPEEGEILFTVHILHGMAEHSMRYDRFADYLSTLGAAVYAQDHRGHGQSATEGGLGYFASKDGWSRVVLDSLEISQMVQGIHPEVPHFLFGHSMGSFIARSLMIDHSHLYDGVILSGTAADKGLLAKVGRLIAVTKSRFNGGRKPDPLLDNLSFGSFAKHFPDRKTDFDWLSRDEDQVRKYNDDPLCGFICTSRFFVDLLDGIALANDESKASRIRSDLPLFLISGEDDPVGDFGKGVRKVYEEYQKAGIRDLRMNLVLEGRHELLNETNYRDIYATIGNWLTEHMVKGR